MPTSKATTSIDIHQRQRHVGAGGAGSPSRPVTIGSVVFTLVVSLVVVAASVAAVLRLALAEPGQPATDRRATHRARKEARGEPYGARRLLASRSEAKRRRKEPRARPPTRTGAMSAAAAIDLDRVGAFQRIRSGVALLLLLAFVGTLLAAVIGTLLFMAGLALRNAVS
jgi:hypothetical protein